MNIEEKVVTALKDKKMLLTTAESCTGGMIASSVVNVSGASNVFHQGYITYCDEAKNSILGVKKETLDKYKAVSPQVACEMAIIVHSSLSDVISCANSSISCDISILASLVLIWLKCDNPEPASILVFCFVSISRPLDISDTLTPLAIRSCDSPAAMLMAYSTTSSCI